MLKRFTNSTPLFPLGQAVTLITRSGELIEGFHVSKRLGSLVELDPSPLPSPAKIGFTLTETYLQPTGCNGRKTFLRGFDSPEAARAWWKQRNNRNKENR